jgi:hypothetical protein
MEPGTEAYKDWYGNKRCRENKIRQRAKRAREKAQKAAEMVDCVQNGQLSGTSSMGLKDLTSYSRQFQKITAYHSRNLALNAVRELIGLSVETQ